MATEVKVIRLEEVKAHNIGRGAEKSVWTVIHDKVYDVTKFLDEVSRRKKLTQKCSFLQGYWILDKSQNICVKNAWFKNPSYLKKIVLELFQNWSKVVPKLSQSCAKVILKLCQSCHKGISKMSQSCPQVVSKLSQSCPWVPKCVA